MFNVTKSPAPAAEFSYKNRTVFDLIQADFFDKCYLCESKIRRHNEVEHFYPKAYFPHLLNEWSNLMSICGKCNTIRPKKINITEEDCVLNPCTDDVETSLSIKYDTGKRTIIIQTNKDTIKVRNTVALLKRIHNGIGSTSFSHIDLGTQIKTEIGILILMINEFEEIKSTESLMEKIREFISRQSAFTAIKKTFISENYPAFKNLFD